MVAVQSQPHSARNTDTIIELLPTDPAELKRRIKEAKEKIADITIQNQPGLRGQWQVTLQQLEARLAEVQ